MLRKIAFSLLIAILLLATVTPSHAYPEGDEQIHMRPFWQGEYGDILGCKNNDVACQSNRQDKRISNKGCALTSMAMLYWAHGFWYIPDKNHQPMPIWTSFWTRLNPSTLNSYLSEKDHFGFAENYDFDWLKTTGNFYYYNDASSAYGYHYAYVVPNYDCYPVDIGQFKKNGSVKLLKKSASCFMTDWSEGARSRLDYDISWGGNYAPPIMKIAYTNFKRDEDGSIIEEPHTHFVVIGGYEKIDGRSDSPGWYRAHNPSFYDNWDNIPKALNGPTQYGMNGGASYRFEGMVTLYRFKNEYSSGLLDTSMVSLNIHSPIEVQIIDPDGNIIGYDPETKTNLLENPMSLYYRETPVTSLDAIGAPEEPYKKLIIIRPRQGNYILKYVGTGDGPYTINMEWTKSDGTPNLVKSFTGTATPSLSETYRVTYSPTGEASLSQANQTPVANAGTAQTGEQSYEITLDGSASYDPDVDPIKYAWSFTSKPEGSTASVSDATAVKPTFTPDKAGTYVLQLVVNDYFTDSVPSTVTITATPVMSRIAVIPNFHTPLSEGQGFILLDVNNIGRVGVTFGRIDLTLKDPDGNAVSTGSQVFSLSVGQSATVSVPVTIPSLKFGDYTLIYSQIDETRSGSSPATVKIPNSVLATFSFDKTSYRARESMNLTLALMNNGKFNLDDVNICFGSA